MTEVSQICPKDINLQTQESELENIRKISTLRHIIVKLLKQEAKKKKKLKAAREKQ